MDKENFNLKIQEETDLIKKLEKEYPKLDSSVHFYHKKNTAWHIHHTKVRDAYWRRRRLIAKRDGLEDPIKVY